MRELLVPPAAERLPEVSVQRAAERPDTGEHEVVLNLVVAQVRVRVDERLEVKRNTYELTMIKLFSKYNNAVCIFFYYVRSIASKNLH